MSEIVEADNVLIIGRHRLAENLALLCIFVTHHIHHTAVTAESGIPTPAKHKQQTIKSKSNRHHGDEILHDRLQQAVRSRLPFSGPSTSNRISPLFTDPERKKKPTIGLTGESLRFDWSLSTVS